MVAKRFSVKIKEYLNHFQVTQIEVANKVNRTQQTISAWCAGKSSPSLDDLPDIAEKLGVSYAWLVGFPGAQIDDKNDGDITEIIKEKLLDQKTMDEAQKMEVNGSMYPVYTEAQLDRRLDMIAKAMDMFDAGKIDMKMLELIVNTMR